MRGLRAAVLSAGAWSQHSHLPTLLADPDVEVVAVTSPAVATRREIAARWPGLEVTDDWARALERTRPDLVVVSSPPALHADQVIAALAAGANVLVEKPFATSNGDARRMVEAARRADRALLVGYSWSSCPEFVAARRVLPRVGTVEHVDARLAVNTRDLLLGSSDGGWGGGATSHSGTYTNAALSGGGAGAVSMSHLLSMLLWITGLRPVSVAAVAFPPDEAIDLHLSSVMRCEGGATVSTATTSLHAGAATPEWSLEVRGSTGDLVVTTRSREVRFIGAGADARWEQVEIADGPLVDQHLPTRTLIEVGRGSQADLSGLSAELAERVVAATEATYSSARDGAVATLHR